MAQILIYGVLNLNSTEIHQLKSTIRTTMGKFDSNIVKNLKYSNLRSDQIDYIYNKWGDTRCSILSSI